MSTNPGVTRAPAASMVRLAVPLTWPTATITPSSMATSPAKLAAPVPSTMTPLRMIRSCMGSSRNLGGEGRDSLQTMNDGDRVGAAFDLEHGGGDDAVRGPVGLDRDGDTDHPAIDVAAIDAHPRFPGRGHFGQPL